MALKTLVLSFPDYFAPPGFPPHQMDGGTRPLTAAGFAALNQAPSLTTLYAGGWTPPQQARFVDVAREAAPRLTILPSVGDNRSPALVFIPCLMLAIGVGLQLTSQFRGPASRLVPGFAGVHAVSGRASRRRQSPGAALPGEMPGCGYPRRSS